MTEFEFKGRLVANPIFPFATEELILNYYGIMKWSTKITEMLEA
jgi:hypothetical protein